MEYIIVYSMCLEIFFPLSSGARNKIWIALYAGAIIINKSLWLCSSCSIKFYKISHIKRILPFKYIATGYMVISRTMTMYVQINKFIHSNIVTKMALNINYQHMSAQKIEAFTCNIITGLMSSKLVHCPPNRCQLWNHLAGE